MASLQGEEWLRKTPSKTLVMAEVQKLAVCPGDLPYVHWQDSKYVRECVGVPEGQK